ncbi:MAG TPA: hypothetical protein VFB72_12030, partial [Verrucomicrobiae bacterium]|nr:hypothetical protein [Verrucomicrobiae bacterium]
MGRTLATALFVLCWLLSLSASAAEENLMFRDDGAGSLVFNTGIIKGSLQKDGKGEALRSLSFIPSNVTIDQNHGLLCPYRFLTPERRYGFGSWEWPRTGRVLPDGAAELHWDEAADRPFAFTTEYRWKSADTLDFKVVFTPKTDLHK